eukprot:TRINITY_DN15116_c0_g1_i2.p1 TRINITY_DN15116_c0_g1~~TRINITY_DN15116_c0_g1_i2.p1  ORF type:complete len:292 (-),score=71.17 TRINITY_DN15116_c0_g1_i2:551-1426(-)
MEEAVFARMLNYICERHANLHTVLIEYDREGTGLMEADDLRLIARKLCWPLKPPELELFVARLADDESGLVRYKELLDVVEAMRENPLADKPKPAPKPSRGARGKSMAREELGRSTSPGSSRLGHSGMGEVEVHSSQGPSTSRSSIYYNRFRRGYQKLMDNANEALQQITPCVLKTLRQVIQAYRPPIALVCLEAMCLIVYEKPPEDWQEAIYLLKQSELRECLLRARPECLSQTGVCRLRQLLYKMGMMEYNQLRPVSVLTNWMSCFEKAADYYTKHTNMLKADDLEPEV